MTLLFCRKCSLVMNYVPLMDPRLDFLSAENSLDYKSLSPSVT